MIATGVLAEAGVRLEPLSSAHVPGLLAAATGDRSSYAYTWVPGALTEMRDYVDRALHAQAEGSAVPYAVVLPATGEVVGSTRLFEFVRFDDTAPHPQAAEIGYTWYAAHVQRTGLNTAVKSLLFTFAFDDWLVLRLSIKTHAANARSRAAIERLGARFEGVRRALPSTQDGTMRDVAFYSVIRSEWPAVKARLASLRRTEA